LVLTFELVDVRLPLLQVCNKLLLPNLELSDHFQLITGILTLFELVVGLRIILILFSIFSLLLWSGLPL